MLKEYRPDWRQNPTRNQAILFFCIWLLSVALLVLSTTNFFTTNPFVRENIVLLLLVLATSFSTLSVCRNYLRNKQKHKG